MRYYDVDSKEWYASPEQADAYEQMFEKQDYANGIIAGELELIREQGSYFYEALGKCDMFIDLGPGVADKSKSILTSYNHRRTRHSHRYPNYNPLAYLAIDIQPKFLENAREKVTDEVTSVETRIGTFEEEIPKLLDDERKKFVYLGATYGNFEPEYMSELLQSGLSGFDFVYLSSARFTSEADLIHQYSNTNADARGFLQQFYERHKLVSAPVDTVIEYNDENECIEIGFRFTDTFYASSRTYRKNDVLIGFSSRKPTKKSFEETIDLDFYGEFFENDLMLGFIGQMHY